MAILELLRSTRKTDAQTFQAEYKALVKRVADGARLDQDMTRRAAWLLGELHLSDETFAQDVANYARAVELETYLKGANEKALRQAYNEALAICSEQEKFKRMVAFRQHERDLAAALKEADANLAKLKNAREELAMLKAASR